MTMSMSVGTNSGVAASNSWRPPEPEANHIERRRLDHLYDRAHGRLLRILAPPGYGKTSLAARWVSNEPRTVRWIDLDRGDDDPVVLFATLREALTDIAEVPTPSTMHVSAVNPYVQALSDGLVSSPRSDPFVLVLDDVHRVRSVAGNWLIRTLVEQLPRDCTVVLIGRGHHDGGAIGSLRLVPGVVDLGVDELSLDDSESHLLLQSQGVDVGSVEIAEVVRLLEGWPAGVRLAGEVLQTSTPADALADHVNLVDYLRDEWVGQLEPDDRAFLREVACLERFTGEKCDEVLERTGSGATLQRLHRDRVVVFPLDHRDQWYRLHGLLNRWLSNELRDLDPQRWTRIHINAAHYWEQHGNIDRAVEHARAANDLDLVERLVITHGGRYFTRGLGATVEKWLESFPPDHTRSSPGLSALHSIEALHAGDEIRAMQWLRIHDECQRVQALTAEDPSAWWGDVLHGALDERPADDLIPRVAAARKQLSGGPWAAFACWVEGALRFMAGDIDGARDALHAGVFEAELIGTPLIAGHCLATMSVIADCDGEAAAATSFACRAQDAIAACGGEVLPPTAPAMAVGALVQARRGDLAAASHGIAAARRALTGFRSVAPWFNVVARLSLVRCALLLDDRDTARILARELLDHTRFERGRGATTERSAVTCARELSAQVDAMHLPATGATALTEAELRVLQLLPTNLSLAEIASSLFISRNTVKSHAAAIYRKLDASKRSEAVERARSAGLLGRSPL